MKRIIKPIAAPVGAVAVLAVMSAAPGIAASLDIGAAINMAADLSINDGVLSDDLALPPAAAVTASASAASAVDDPAASNTDDHFSQVGNPFTDPPTPFIATAFDATTQPDGDEARGFYYVEDTVTPDLDGHGRPTWSERNLTATAQLGFADLDVDASASGAFDLGRDLILTNTSATTSYAFTIGTGFDMNLTASADDLGSYSIAEAIFGLTFISTGSVLLDLSGPLGGSTTVDDADPGTSVTSNLVTSNALFDGVYYQASVAATGTGAETEASLQAAARFLFDVQMAPGSTLRMSFFQRQDVMTSYDAPPLAPVPLPATGVVLLFGLGAFGALRRRRA